MNTLKSSKPNNLSQQQSLLSSSTKPSTISTTREYRYQHDQKHDLPSIIVSIRNKSSCHADHCAAAKSKDDIAPGGLDTPTLQYHDFSSAPDIEIRRKIKGGVKVPFPVKLFHLLEHIDLYEPVLANIISWQPHGRCFLTRDIKMMEEHNVLARIFRQNNYASFRRQLNLWGFKRIIQGPDYGAYYHELFLRGKPYLCRALNRLNPRKKAASSINSNEDEPPRFYSMPVLPLSFLTFVPAAAAAAVMNAEDEVTPAASTQDTEQEHQPVMMCTAEAEYGHSHTCTAAHRNLAVYPIGNSPPATDQEMSDIMTFLKKLDQSERCVEQSAEKKQG